MEEAVQEARCYHLPVRPAHAEPQERQAEPELAQHEHLLPPDAVAQRGPDEAGEERARLVGGDGDAHVQAEVVDRAAQVLHHEGDEGEEDALRERKAGVGGEGGSWRATGGLRLSPFGSWR